jgi:hypothetical protein
VQPQPGAGGDSHDVAQLLQRPDPPAGHVRRLLDGHQPRPRHVPIAGAPQRAAHVVAREHPQRRVQRVQHRPRERRRPTGLGDDRVRQAMQDCLVAPRTDVEPERDLVAHRPGGKEDGGFEPEQRSHPRAELGDLRVLEALLVAHFRLRHGLAHGGGRTGLRV